MSEDRTAEFLSLARGLPPGSRSTLPPPSVGGGSGGSGMMSGRYGGAGALNSNPHGSKDNGAYNDLKAFHQTASGISKDIAATSHLLSQLTDLVKHSSQPMMMSDSESSQRMNQLVMAIKASIENLNGRLDSAGQTIAQQKRRLGRNSQAGQEASNLVTQLQEEFGMTATQFKKILQQRTDNLKSTEDQQRQVYGAGSSSAAGPAPSLVSLDNRPVVYQSSMGVTEDGLPNMPNMAGAAGFPTLDLTSGMSAGEPTSSTASLPRPHGALYSTDSSGMRLRRQGSSAISGSEFMSPGGGGTVAGGANLYGTPGGPGMMSGGGVPLTPLDMQRMEQESNQQQSMQLIPDQTYLRERADAMQQVEADIVELGTIFNKLAVMVSEHRDLVQRVEDNVDEANTNMEMSMNVLMDALQNARNNKALFGKIFGILVTFILIFVVFFA